MIDLETVYSADVPRKYVTLAVTVVVPADLPVMVTPPAPPDTEQIAESLVESDGVSLPRLLTEPSLLTAFT